MRIIIIMMLFLLPIHVFAQKSDAELKVSEAMAVCDNMTLYVQSAQRQRAMGMPIDEAKQLTTTLMEKNLKLEPHFKNGAISLAMEIYSYVYSNQETNEIESILTNTCGKYRGYNIAVDVVAKHIATTAQSAWNPLERVPLCTKLAQSVSNIAVARDRGMDRNRMADITKSALSNDKFTRTRAKDLIAQAYDNPDLEAANLFGFNLVQCRAEMRGESFSSLSELKPKLLACQTEASNESKAKCARNVFHLDDEN